LRDEILKAFSLLTMPGQNLFLDNQTPGIYIRAVLLGRT